MVYCLVSNQNRYDFIIQGAGASGLWLAHALNEMELLKNKRLLIVEGDLNKVFKIGPLHFIRIDIQSAQ